MQPKPDAVGLGVRPPMQVEEIPDPGTEPPRTVESIRARLAANAAPLPTVAAVAAVAPEVLAKNIESLVSTLPVAAAPRSPGAGQPLVEVELKFRVPTREDATGQVVSDLAGFRETVRQRFPGAVRGDRLREEDEYFSAPWMEPDTYVRIRSAARDSRPPGGPPLQTRDLTWKGPKLDAESKSRHEETVLLLSTDANVASMTRLLAGMGYARFATVVKDREPWTLTHAGAEVSLLIDRVMGLGDFIELEIVTLESAMMGAVAILTDLAMTLGLGRSERRGYVELLQMADAQVPLAGG